MSQPACAVSDWKHVSGNVNMKTGNAITCGDYTIKLVDVSYGDKATDTALLFEIASTSGKKEVAIVAAGGSYLFCDDNYKVTFVNYKNKKINVAAYRTLRPVFRIATETKKSNSISYTHITSVVFECKEKTASNIVIQFSCENVTLNGRLRDIEIGTCAVGAKPKATLRYTPHENASIVAKVVYEGTGGKKYEQCIDVISNLPVVEEITEVAATDGTVTVKKITNENNYKRVFIRAIDVAIKRITFTDEQKTQLMKIKESLELSIK